MQQDPIYKATHANANENARQDRILHPSIIPHENTLLFLRTADGLNRGSQYV
jgi:hypothetical protein